MTRLFKGKYLVILKVRKQLTHRAKFPKWRHEWLLEWGPERRPE